MFILNRSISFDLVSRLTNKMMNVLLFATVSFVFIVHSEGKSIVHSEGKSIVHSEGKSIVHTEGKFTMSN
jgi:hypothetical protein